MTTLRVTVKAPSVEVADEVKEQFFKKLYEHSGTKVIFELPAGADDSDIRAFAEARDCEVSAEDYDDPLEGAEAVDFW